MAKRSKKKAEGEGDAPKASRRSVGNVGRRAIALGATALSFVSQVEEVSIGVEGFGVTVNGLVVHGRPDFERCQKAGDALRVQEKGSPFALGDYILYIEDALGEEAAQILDYTSGWSESTCNNYRWLASRIAPETRRMDRLGVKHHQLVAALGPKQQAKWLNAAAADGEDKPWTAARLGAAIREGVDAPPLAYWVLVLANDQPDQNALMAELESKGRTVKALMRRQPKSKELTE